MKQYRALFVGLIMSACYPSLAQTKPKPPSDAKNLIQVSFSQKWTYQLDDPAKLIDIGPITDPHKSSLVALQGGSDAKDSSRKLIVMHWDGMHFAKDSSMDFHGLPVDSLLIGKFRSAKDSPVQRSPFDRTLPGSRGNISPAAPIGGLAPPAPLGPNGKPPIQWPPTQVVTTEGIYAWMNKGMSRLFGAPLDVRLSLVLAADDQDDKLVTGSGDNTAEYEVGENYVRESSDGAPTSGDGYVRFASGTQNFNGADKMVLASGVRYVQSVWEPKSRWMLGVAAGVPAKQPDGTVSTPGDRLVVFVPRYASRAKSFWQMTMDDFEEDWRSDPLPGRLLDVRVGDPKNNGKVGILVLTSENKDTEGHLYFYTQDK
jgi:hypothetical protein